MLNDLSAEVVRQSKALMARLLFVMPLLQHFEGKTIADVIQDHRPINILKIGTTAAWNNILMNS
jgi:hypothetical protein